MKISLNISERLYVLALLNQFKGDLDKLAIVLDDIKQYPVADAEWEKAERKITKTSDGGDQWIWDDKKGGEKEIDINKVVADYLRTTIKGKSDKGELGLPDKALISLDKKLG